MPLSELLLLFAAQAFVLGDPGGFRAIRVDAEGRAVAAGWTDGGAAVERYLADGRPDPSFAKVRIRQGDDRFHGVTVDASGRVIAVGTSARRAIVARFLPGGSLDESFGERGVVRGRGGESFLEERKGEAVDRFESVEVDSKGRLVVAGVARGFRPSGWGGTFICRWFDLRFCWSYENTSILARFLPDGTLDPSFGGSGFILGKEGARWHVGPHDELIQAILLEDDRIAAAGWASGETYDDERTIMATVLPDGRLDAFELSPPDSLAGGTKEVLYGLTRDRDRLIACGFSFDRSRHIRALTKTYEGGELKSHTLANARQLADSDVEYFVKCAVDAEGRTVAVGYTDDDWSYTDEPHRALLARYLPDGTLDASFSSYQNGRSIFGERKNDGFYDVAIDREGRIWVAGSSNGRTLIYTLTL